MNSVGGPPHPLDATRTVVGLGCGVPEVLITGGVATHPPITFVTPVLVLHHVHYNIPM